MTTADIPRYTLVDGEVTGRQDYGLIVRAADNRPGFVDSADIADEPVPQEEWPSTGTRLRGVVLGVTRDGRLRLSLRPRDVTLVESVPDPAGALRTWHALRRGDPDTVRAFQGSVEARALLRWALAHPAGSPDRELGERLLTRPPPGDQPPASPLR